MKMTRCYTDALPKQEVCNNKIRRFEVTDDGLSDKQLDMVMDPSLSWGQIGHTSVDRLDMLESIHS